MVAEFHPAPIYFETNYADIPLDKFFGFDEPLPAAAEDKGAPADAPPLTQQELDQFLDDLLDSPGLEITPPDTLMSVAYQWSGNHLDQVRAMAAALPPSVVRAKGFVEQDGELNLFSYRYGRLDHRSFRCGKKTRPTQERRRIHRPTGIHGRHRGRSTDWKLGQLGDVPTF